MSAPPRTIRFTLNGRAVAAAVAPGDTLVALLRDRFDLFGARESCGQGLCGCCTVLVDGAPVSSCLFLAVFADGAEILTVEHLAAGDRLDPVQEAFIEASAFQCGFCTPGFVLMTKALLDEHPEPSDEQIRHYLSGNLCRCGAYPEILAAVRLAARKRAASRRTALTARLTAQLAGDRPGPRSRQAPRRPRRSRSGPASGHGGRRRSR